MRWYDPIIATFILVSVVGLPILLVMALLKYVRGSP